MKVRLHQEVVVGGWWPGTGNREGGMGSLIVGVHEPSAPGNPLRYAGKVGTGFTASTLRDYEGLLSGLATDDVPVRPGAAAPRQSAGDVGAARDRDRGRVRRVDRRGRAPPSEPPRAPNRQGPAEEVGRVRDRLDAGGAEASEVAAGRVEGVDRPELDLLDPLHHELGDPVATQHMEGAEGSRFTSSTLSSSR